MLSHHCLLGLACYINVPDALLLLTSTCAGASAVCCVPSALYNSISVLPTAQEYMIHMLLHSTQHKSSHMHGLEAVSKRLCSPLPRAPAPSFRQVATDVAADVAGDKCWDDLNAAVVHACKFKPCPHSTQNRAVYRLWASSPEAYRVSDRK